MLLDDVDASVRGTTVDHDVLDAGIVLAQHRSDRRLKIGRLLIRRRNHGDEREAGHLRLSYFSPCPAQFSTFLAAECQPPLRRLTAAHEEGIALQDRPV